MSTTPSSPAAPAADPLHRLLELSACWRRASGLPAGVPAPSGPVDPATLSYCGAVVHAALLRYQQLLDAEEAPQPADDKDPLAALVGVTDFWVSGLPGQDDLPPPTALDPGTLRYCGSAVQEAVFGLLAEVLREVAEEERAARVRGMALFLWRVWVLAQALRDAAPPEGGTEDLWQHIDRQLQRAADRLARAAQREGRCAVQEGCGCPHETVAAAPPDPGAFQALLAALAALGVAWQDTPPASHRAAGDQLAALLRQHRALHDAAAAGLCAACHPIFLDYLAPTTHGEAG